MPSSTRRLFLQSSAAAAALSSTAVAANDQIQVAMIGCGARSVQLMQALQRVPGNQIVGVVDAYTGRLERAQDWVGPQAKIYPDYRAVLADKAIDAVVIATPDHWHHRMCMDAMQAGKDVYSEKPLTYRSAEGVSLIEAARSQKRILQVGSQGVSSPLQQKARELVQAGRIGKVTMIRAAYNRNTASGAWIYPIPPDASPKTVNWEMFLGSAPKRPLSLERFFRWRCYEDYSGGIATDLFVHLCTTIHHVTGAKVPSRVMAMGELYRWKDREVPDTLNAMLEYPEGFAVNLSSTFNNQTSAGTSFEFLGTQGTLALNGNELKLFPDQAREDNRWIIDSWPKKLAEAYYRDPKVRESELPPAQGTVQEGALTMREQGPESTVPHFANWVQSIRTRKPFWEDAVAGHHAAACAHMVNQSAKQRRMVEWDSQKDDIKAS